MELDTKYGVVKIYAETIDGDAISQIMQMANSVLGENAHIRIMPDAHSGAGCVIGTTMRITNKVCPNLVGVDIGCGVTLVKTDLNFSDDFSRLDEVIRKYVPSGRDTHNCDRGYDFSPLYCWKNLSKDAKNLAARSLGTLGGGNHFIEAYDGGYLAVHSGSRNIGLCVATHYQNLAEKKFSQKQHDTRMESLKLVDEKDREAFLRKNKISVQKELCYLDDESFYDYLHDVDVMQQFAAANRASILSTIVKRLGGTILETLDSIHNYVDVKNRILRKGAISAQKDEALVIPLNMHDGLLICRGKGNEDWNFSAPHGAGRLYSRSVAKSIFTVEEYAKEMEGIFTTCVGQNTLDEAPFAYKDYREIMRAIEPTVEIEKRLLPIYNFKAGE